VCKYLIDIDRPSTVVTILGRKKRNTFYDVEEDGFTSVGLREGRQANNNRNNNKNQLIGSGVITGLSNVTRVDDAEIRVPDSSRTLVSCSLQDFFFDKKVLL
jgi:hypothetical protein